MNHQKLSLGKYWELFRETLNEQMLAVSAFNFGSRVLAWVAAGEEMVSEKSESFYVVLEN